MKEERVEQTACLSTQHTWFCCWFEHDVLFFAPSTFLFLFSKLQDTPHCCFSLLPSKSCSAMICTVSSPSLSWQCPSPPFGPSWPLVPINGCSALCCSLHSLVGWVSVSYQWEHCCTGRDRWELLSALSSLRAAPEIIANVWVVLTAKVLTMGGHSSPSYYRMSNRVIWLSEQCSVPCVNTLQLTFEQPRS